MHTRWCNYETVLKLKKGNLQISGQITKYELPVFTRFIGLNILPSWQPLVLVNTGKVNWMINRVLFPHSFCDIFQCFWFYFGMWESDSVGGGGVNLKCRRGQLSEPGFLDLRLRNSVTVATAATTILTTIFGEHANVPDVAPGVSHTRLHLTLSTLWGCNYILILGMRYLMIREITLSRSWDSNTHISNSSTKSVNKRKKIPLQYH